MYLYEYIFFIYFFFSGFGISRLTIAFFFSLSLSSERSRFFFIFLFFFFFDQTERSNMISQRNNTRPRQAHFYTKKNKIYFSAFNPQHSLTHTELRQTHARAEGIWDSGGIVVFAVLCI